MVRTGLLRPDPLRPVFPLYLADLCVCNTHEVQCPETIERECHSVRVTIIDEIDMTVR